MDTQKTNASEIVRLVFKALGLAMAVAALVLSIMDSAAPETRILLLSMGAVAIAINSLNEA